MRMVSTKILTGWWFSAFVIVYTQFKHNDPERDGVKRMVGGYREC